MSVSEVSTKSYSELLSENKLQPMQETVLKFFYDYPESTDLEIKQVSGLEINMITGRRNKLVELGLIRECGKIRSEKTGRTSTIWEIGATPEEKIIIGLTQTKFNRTIKNINHANQFQKQKLREELGRLL